MDDPEIEVEWSSQLEDILAQEGERCSGLAWLHTRAEILTGTYNAYVQVPVIILSTLAGTASVGSTTLFDGDTKSSSIVIGLVSIGVGILNTLGGFFAFAKRSEAHRIAHLNYSKLASKMKVSSLKVYVQAQNLITWTNYSGFDPEVSTFTTTNTAQGTDFLTFPQAKTITFGLNVGF